MGEDWLSCVDLQLRLAGTNLGLDVNRSRLSSADRLGSPRDDRESVSRRLSYGLFHFISFQFCFFFFSLFFFRLFVKVNAATKNSNERAALAEPVDVVVEL